MSGLGRGRHFDVESGRRQQVWLMVRRQRCLRDRGTVPAQLERASLLWLPRL